MDSVADYVDLVRFGWGTAYVTRELRRKLDTYRDHGVPAMLGGTLTELAWLQGKVDDLRRWLDELRDRARRGLQRRRPDPARARSSRSSRRSPSDRTVFAEVGEKDPHALMAPYRWVELIDEALEAGADAGRSARAAPTARPASTGPTARSRTGLVDEVAHEIDVDRLIFEAPAAPPADLVHRALRHRRQRRQRAPARRHLARDAARRPARRHAHALPRRAGRDPPRPTRRDGRQRPAAALHGLARHAAERPRARAGAGARARVAGTAAPAALWTSHLLARPRDGARSSAPRSASSRASTSAWPSRTAGAGRGALRRRHRARGARAVGGLAARRRRLPLPGRRVAGRAPGARPGRARRHPRRSAARARRRHGGTIRAIAAAAHPRGLDAFHDLEVPNGALLATRRPGPMDARRVAVVLTGVGKRYDIVSAFSAARVHDRRRPEPAGAGALRRRRRARAAARSTTPATCRSCRRLVERHDARAVVPLTDLDLEVLARGRPARLRPRRRGRARDVRQVRDARAARCASGCRARRRACPRSEPDELPGDGQAAPRLGRALDPPGADREEKDFFARYVKEPVMVQRLMDGPEFSIDLLCDLDGRCLNAIPRTMIESRGGESIKGTVIADPELIDLGRAVGEALPRARAVHRAGVPRPGDRPRHHRRQHALRRRVPGADVRGAPGPHVPRADRPAWPRASASSRTSATSRRA